MTAEIEKRTFLREFTIDFLSGMSGGDDPILEYLQYCRYIYICRLGGGAGGSAHGHAQGEAADLRASLLRGVAVRLQHPRQGGPQER